ncbi:MAG: hypothetical protein M1831_001766 [Alyxoria varia]|nr:MAG: hypothetical protein M1831_001766 [Alyxoria varia]
MSGASNNGQSATKRLLHELRSNEEDPNPALLFLRPVDEENVFLWEALLKGVPGTAYEEGQWLLSIQIPTQYPLHPPSITFKTPIAHPNIHFKTGEICLDLLKSSGWSPAYTISSTLTSVQQLLLSAEVESPLNVDVARLVRDGDWVGAESLTRFYSMAERWDGW